MFLGITQIYNAHAFLFILHAYEYILFLHIYEYSEKMLGVWMWRGY